MQPDSSRFEGRFAGALIAAAALAALLFMAHHPTTAGASGGDDGYLLHDWSNTLVHGVMLTCLLALLFGFSIFSRRLDERHLSVRAAQMVFTGAVIAMAGAAMVSGFATGELAARLDAAAAAAQFATLAALNQAAAKLGIALAGAALALWSVRIIRLDIVSKIAGGLGILLALAAAAFLLHHHGVGLHAMAHAVLAFAIWSLIVAAQLIRGRL